ncbi:MAG: hypothetical protein ACMUEM_04780 [Flavobacteriales bacterium AspAUS03]
MKEIIKIVVLSKLPDPNILYIDTRTNAYHPDTLLLRTGDDLRIQ